LGASRQPAAQTVMALGSPNRTPGVTAPAGEVTWIQPNRPLLLPVQFIRHSHTSSQTLLWLFSIY